MKFMSTILLLIEMLSYYSNFY